MLPTLIYVRPLPFMLTFFRNPFSYVRLKYIILSNILYDPLLISLFIIRITFHPYVYNMTSIYFCIHIWIKRTMPWLNSIVPWQGLSFSFSMDIYYSYSFQCSYQASIVLHLIFTSSTGSNNRSDSYLQIVCQSHFISYSSPSASSFIMYFKWKLKWIHLVVNCMCVCVSVCIHILI